jgi:formylglycine-generating enzyme required for sulfatase activity
MKHTYLLFLTVILLSGSNLYAQQYPEMIKVKGGTFKMGDELGVGEKDELPVHNRTIKTFGIAKTETTVLQWKTYCNATVQQMPKAPQGGWVDNDPIVNVSWEDAVAYCNWLSSKTGKQYRLPTEAEWEFAARGGNKNKGFHYSGSQNIDSVAWNKNNSNNLVHAVAQKTANELGLYDMTGNLWEWCMDWHVFEAYTFAQTNKKDDKVRTTRVIRGGSAITPPLGCRTASRGNSEPTFRDPYCGFRVAIQL